MKKVICYVSSKIVLLCIYKERSSSIYLLTGEAMGLAFSGFIDASFTIVSNDDSFRSSWVRRMIYTTRDRQRHRRFWWTPHYHHVRIHVDRSIDRHSQPCSSASGNLRSPVKDGFLAAFHC
jgi:hypothetical protein